MFYSLFGFYWFHANSVMWQSFTLQVFSDEDFISPFSFSDYHHYTCIPISTCIVIFHVSLKNVVPDSELFLLFDVFLQMKIPPLLCDVLFLWYSLHSESTHQSKRFHLALQTFPIPFRVRKLISHTETASWRDFSKTLWGETAGLLWLPMWAPPQNHMMTPATRLSMPTEPRRLSPRYVFKFLLVYFCTYLLFLWSILMSLVLSLPYLSAEE